jgi:hypothetical protein
VDWELPPDIRQRLQADPVVWENFERFPDSYRRIRIGWIDRRPAGPRSSSSGSATS